MENFNIKNIHGCLLYKRGSTPLYPILPMRWRVKKIMREAPNARKPPVRACNAADGFFNRYPKEATRCELRHWALYA